MFTRNVVVIGKGESRNSIARKFCAFFSVKFEDVPTSKSIQFMKFKILECRFMLLKSNFNADFSAHNQYNS